MIRRGEGGVGDRLAEWEVERVDFRTPIRSPRLAADGVAKGWANNRF
jgi:hypothetical protein